MLYFVENKERDAIVTVCDDWSSARLFEEAGAKVWCRNDYKSLAEAERVATLASQHEGDDVFVATETPGCHPRWDVIRAPKVGDPVSYAFNGDYTPCGNITRISKSLRRVETDDGKVFFRRGTTGRWVMTGGTWAMVAGHITERNPHF